MKFASMIVISMLLLAGCGDQNQTATAEDPTVAAPTDASSEMTLESNPADGSKPSCDDIWVAGLTLPQDYDGCVDQDGFPPAEGGIDCTDGSKIWFLEDSDTGDDALVGVSGQKVIAGTDERAIGKATEDCFG